MGKATQAALVGARTLRAEKKRTSVGLAASPARHVSALSKIGRLLQMTLAGAV